MKTVFKNVLLDGKITDITVTDGKITSVDICSDDGIDMHGLKVYPGLIDIHSHGAVGIDTMECNLGDIAEYELRHGITTWYPTTMTVSAEDIIAAMKAKTDFENGANIPGFHMEGPFINVNKKGGQNEKYVIPPSLELLEKCPTAKLVTVAPEIEGAMDFIKKCGIVVCIGHTEADYECTKEAIAAGAACLTHTFNAMPGIHHRAPAVIGAGADCGAYAQLICDGFHVHPSVVRMLIRIFGYDKIVLISDSIAATGLSDGTYICGGQRLNVKDGKALLDDGTICGSTHNLFDCVKLAISFGIPECEAVRMATVNPAKLMGLNKGYVLPGYDADLIFVDDEFTLKSVVVRGKVCNL